MAQAMGYDITGMSDVKAADLAIEGINRLADDVDIPQNFTSIPAYTKSQVATNGFPEITTTDSDIEQLTVHALGDVCTATNPRIMSPESMGAVIADSLLGNRS